MSRRRGPAATRYGVRLLLGVGVLLMLSGCTLDQSPTVRRGALYWTTGVNPAVVCPGESVQLSYEAYDEPVSDDVQVSVQVDGSPSDGDVTFVGSSNSGPFGPVTGPTTFTFTSTGGIHGGARERQPYHHTVEVLPMAESTQPLDFRARCTGDVASWEEVRLSVPEFRARTVRLVLVCNNTPDTVRLTLVFGQDARGAPIEQRWTLSPGDCTEDLPPEQGAEVTAARATPLLPSSPMRCTTSSSGRPRDIQLTGILTCDG